MATDAEILVQLDAAILKVSTDLAAGRMVTEYWDGDIRIKKESPIELLKALRALRAEYACSGRADEDRRPGALYYGGRQ